MEPSHEDMHIDPIAVVADEEEEDVDVVAVASPSRASPSLCSMVERILETQSSQHIIMETFMMTQATHRQLLDFLISNVAALRVDSSKYTSSFPPPPPLED